MKTYCVMIRINSDLEFSSEWVTGLRNARKFAKDALATTLGAYSAKIYEVIDGFVRFDIGAVDEI